MKYRKTKLTKTRWWIFPLVLVCIIGNLLISTQNTSLIYAIQSKQAQIAELKETNQKLKDEISLLKDKDRIIDIASESGLSSNLNNIIYIQNNSK